MNLFLSDINKSFEDLLKAGNPGGGPRTGNPGGGPRTGAPRNVTSLPGPKTGNPGGGARTGAGAGMKAPSTPGAVSGGGKQIVDCPLGADCPDGGKHQMGGAMYQEHLAQSMKHAQTGAKPNDESKGQPTEKPGVQPGSQNIGSLGSDQVQPKTQQMDMSSQVAASAGDKTQAMKLDPQEKKLRRNESRAKQTQETPMVGAEATQEMPAATQEMDTSPTLVDSAAAQPVKRTPPGEGELPDTGPTRRNMKATANVDATGENPAEDRQTIRMQAVNGDPNKKRQPVPNPLDPNTAPITSKPADHYKLAQVARASGDEEGAKAQEELARKRAANFGSEEHKQLADQLRRDGLNDHADYHDSIHQRVNSYKKEEPPKSPEAESQHKDEVRGVHDTAAVKANKDLEDAKKKHAETKAKAEEIKAKNAEKLKAHEQAMKDHEAAKASGNKKAKPPKKPKLDKEPKVPDSPELVEPGSEGEKLKHENHTTRAKRTADMIESHLKNNSTLSGEERRRLERAHQMAVYHSKIGYTPTATHKSELGEVERTMKDLGIKEHWDDVKSREDAQAAAAAVKDVEKERVSQEKQEEKAKAKAPKRPETPIDHAKVAAHRDAAKKLRETLQSHKDGNPNMSEEDHARVDLLMSELDAHENQEHLPDGETGKKLKELQRLAGDQGKKPYEPEEEEAEPKGGSLNRRDTAGFLMQQFHSGRAVGAGLAQSATSPYGAAGHLAPQLAGYGLHGATSAGHKLLQRTEDGNRTQDKLDDQKEAQAKEAEKQQKKAEKADKPELRGLAGGNS